MSHSVTNICRPAQMPPTAKNVLMAIADRADDSGFAWPSIPGLCEATCYGRTAVIEAMKYLELSGFVAVEKSAGRQNRMTINLQRVADAYKTRLDEARAVRLADPSVGRTGLPNEPVRLADYSGPPDVLLPVRLADPPVRQADSNHQQPPQEHQGSPVKTAQRKVPRASGVDRPEDVDGQVWADWNQLRRQKKAPVTATVVGGARAEADKAGITLESFLRAWCVRGSQGLMADWLKPHERGGQGATAHRSPRGPLSAEEQAIESREKGERLLAARRATGGAVVPAVEVVHGR